MPKKNNNSISTRGTSGRNSTDIGRIVSFFSGVAKISGLPHVFLHEVLLSESGIESALVIGFNENYVEAVFFDGDFDIETPLFRSFKNFRIPVTEDYIGRIVNGFGKPIDGFGDVSDDGVSMPIFREAIPIIDRKPVSVPFSTGIKMIDASLPLGRGQRELIIGDRKLGKSSIAIDAVLNQAVSDPRVYCVYVVCGQKEDDVRQLVALLKKNNAFLYSIVVAATADSTFAEQYLAPFVGCTIAEHFRDNAKDALIVYDDLSKHAKAYRSISLLLERAPGREAYPGDIFSLHAGLLERAAQLSDEKGGGSLTALPIIETQEDDITSYIPTNVISITDGQIYLERDLFQRGSLPAVNIGLSISRIGSQAQPKALSSVVGGIRLTLSRHQELERMSQLESNLSAAATQEVKRGVVLTELLKQKEHTNIQWPEQVVLFHAINTGLFDDIDRDKLSDAGIFLGKLLSAQYLDIFTEIKSGNFDDKVKKRIVALVKDLKLQFI